MGWLSRKKPPTNRSASGNPATTIEFADAVLRNRASWLQSSPRTVEEWELNAEFFTALSQWTLDHPETTLDHILQRVSNAIDEGKNYTQFIPNAPFPARELVESVAQLILLSVKISHSQREVRDFAIEIIRWVSHVKESFVRAGNGRFTSITWDNLADIQSLIDDICCWAAERLKDGRWNIKNTKIEGEIMEFKDRMDDSRKTFNDRSLIVISGGLDAIFQFLWAVFFSQYILIVALENLQKAQDEHFRRILQEQQRRTYLEEKLHGYTVQNPTYGMQSKYPCSPGTRKEIIKEIQTWIDDHSKESRNFLWLVGPPGCGKSAIAASIAEYCSSREILGAQFFINRNNYNMTDPKFYFPTVARDLYKRSESVEQHLYDTLRRHKFSVDTPEKAVNVFLDTVCKAARDSPEDPIVVVFDGLDETSRDRLENIATLFSQLFPCLLDYPNVKILISSRPQREILHSFRDITHKQHVEELQIVTSDENSRRDVKAYLDIQLTEISKKHHLSAALWPGDERLDKLVDQASGLFIWAVTACKYINMRLCLDGTEALDTVLNQFENAAMTDINTLYLKILQDAYPPGYSDEWTLEKFRRLVGIILVLREPMNVRDIGALVDLRKTPNSAPVDIKNFVDHLRTLLIADLDDVTEDTIPQAHKSFFDCVTSPGSHIPEVFHIDVEASNAEMTLLCLRQLTIVYSDIYNTHYASKELDLKTLSVPVLYSLRFALSHIPQAQNGTLGVISDHPGVINPSQLDALLNRSSHPSHAGPLAFSVPSNNAFVGTSFADHHLIWDSKYGSATMVTSIDFLCPFMNFSPGGTHTFLCRTGSIACIPSESYDLNKGITLVPLPIQVRNPTLRYSFDGTRFAFATSSETIFLYRTTPYVIKSEIPNRNQATISKLQISPRNSYVAIASRKANDFFMDIWDVDSECYINESGSMHQMYPGPDVYWMVFSPDETLLISCDTLYAYIWEGPAWNQKHSFPSVFEYLEGSPGALPIAFSPDSQTILAGSIEGTVSLWNPHTAERIGEPWKVPGEGHHTERSVYHVAFRSCGTIALTCCAISVCVWNTCQGTPITVIPTTRDHFGAAVFTPDGAQLLYNGYKSTLGICNLAPLLLDSKNTFKPNWTALSPGGNLVVSVANNLLLCWRLDVPKVVGNPLRGSRVAVTMIAFSADEAWVAGAAEDGSLYLWDSTSQTLLSSLHDCVPQVWSLSFSPDGAYIVAKLLNRQLVVLAITDGTLSVVNEDNRINALQKAEVIAKSTFFDIDKPPVTFGTNPTVPNGRLKDVQWYPSRSDSVVWGYVNNHIIRAGKDGSFVVVPVGDVSK